MTTAEIAVRDFSLTEKVQYAKFLAESGLLPPSYRKQPANILFATEYGELLGLHPIAAITGINVIDGKPSISASLISALVRRAGHRLRVQATGSGDDAKARCQITRADDPGFTYGATWDMQRARQADLLGKTNWRRYPMAMLKARAISECARDACPEVLLGLHYTPDELGAEDDGGEIISDGFPTTGNGMVDQAQLSEETREQAGFMDRKRRLEHADLREMNKVNPADLEHDTEPQDDDPWAEPDRPPRRAGKTALAKLDGLLRSLDLGPGPDIQVLFRWILGNAEYKATVRQVSDLIAWFESHLAAKDVAGDFGKARDAIWKQYQDMHPEEGGTLMGGGDA